VPEYYRSAMSSSAYSGSGKENGFWVSTSSMTKRMDYIVGRTWIGPAVLALLVPISLSAGGEGLPAEIAADGLSPVLQLHAEGAQIYECKADKDGHLIWQFREPIASLFRDGKTVGRHYAGPTWEVDSSMIVGKVVAHTPGSTANDIPWLKLQISDTRGDQSGPLKDVTTVQRINTKGGNLEGVCGKIGDLQAEPYSADYVFLGKPQ
jgi:hypothetical protein